MKKYLLPMKFFISSLILFIIFLIGIDKIDKINFLIDPYFWSWALSILLFLVGCLISIYYMIKGLYNYLFTKK